MNLCLEQKGRKSFFVTWYLSSNKQLDTGNTSLGISRWLTIPENLVYTCVSATLFYATHFHHWLDSVRTINLILNSLARVFLTLIWPWWVLKWIISDVFQITQDQNIFIWSNFSTFINSQVQRLLKFISSNPSSYGHSLALPSGRGLLFIWRKLYFIKGIPLLAGPNQN